MFINSDKIGKGFTLIEIIVAILVMTVGILGIYTLVPKVISITGANVNRFIASQLAREGIEIVRNIRDTNWVQARDPTKTSPWNDGLPNGDWEADYTTITFADTVDFETCMSPGYNCDTFDGDFLKIEAGFYNYTSGTETKFKRKITITPDTDILNVKVEVSWVGDSFVVEENLYNWQ